jgi:hypothetical protein
VKLACDDYPSKVSDNIDNSVAVTEETLEDPSTHLQSFFTEMALDGEPMKDFLTQDEFSFSIFDTPSLFDSTFFL